MSYNTIYFSKKSSDLFLNFWKKFESKINFFNNVSIDNGDDRIGLKFEIVPQNKIPVIKLLKIWICDSLIFYYKTKYFINNLILPDYLKSKSKLLCVALAIFDKSTDVNICLTKLNFTHEFDVDSFYYFKLQELRFRWQEVCNLLHGSLPDLVATDAFNELLKYLLETTDPECSIVKLYIDGNSIVVLKENLETPILKLPLNQDNLSINIVLELISMAPQKIVIVDSKRFDFALKNSLKNLFGSKIIFNT